MSLHIPRKLIGNYGYQVGGSRPYLLSNEVLLPSIADRR